MCRWLVLLFNILIILIFWCHLLGWHSFWLPSVGISFLKLGCTQICEEELSSHYRSFLASYDMSLTYPTPDTSLNTSRHGIGGWWPKKAGMLLNAFCGEWRQLSPISRGIIVGPALRYWQTVASVVSPFHASAVFIGPALWPAHPFFLNIPETSQYPFNEVQCCFSWQGLVSIVYNLDFWFFNLFNTFKFSYVTALYKYSLI